MKHRHNLLVSRMSKLISSDIIGDEVYLTDYEVKLAEARKSAQVNDGFINDSALECKCGTPQSMGAL